LLRTLSSVNALISGNALWRYLINQTGKSRLTERTRFLVAALISIASLLSCFAAGNRSRALAPSSSPSQQKGLAVGNTLGERYLLLVNTAIASMMTPEKMAQFDKSSYNGLAVAFWHAYDTSAVISSNAMTSKIAEWNRVTKKDIWPWVYVNRMIAADPASNNHYTKDPYFHRFVGADLDGRNGAQNDFLQNWTNSLRAARDSGVPGIVCDLEFYNFYKEYDVGELARQTSKTPQQVVELLRSLGARMAGIADSQYPQATLWLLFTGFTHPGYKSIDNEPYYPSPTYIAMGLLDEIKSRHLSLKVISGGEGSLAYCHDSLEQFQAAIKDRQAKFAPQLEKYKDVLELAGTMTLYTDRSEMKDWVKKDCSSSDAAKLEDLQPYLELLLKTYHYNWIYASGDGGYTAFSPGAADRFDSLIRKAEARASVMTLH
jgi:hypothetical protein